MENLQNTHSVCRHEQTELMIKQDQTWFHWIIFKIRATPTANPTPCMNLLWLPWYIIIYLTARITLSCTWNSYDFHVISKRISAIPKHTLNLKQKHLKNTSCYVIAESLNWTQEFQVKSSLHHVDLQRTSSSGTWWGSLAWRGCVAMWTRWPLWCSGRWGHVWPVRRKKRQNIDLLVIYWCNDV